jgi:hypothetical protein
MNARIVIESDYDGDVTYEWHGGAYINVSIGERAIDVINVWDYVDDKPVIPFTVKAMMRTVKKYDKEMFGLDGEGW